MNKYTSIILSLFIFFSLFFAFEAKADVLDLKPIIYLNGESSITHERGTSYDDAGAYAIDRDGSRVDGVLGDVSSLNVDIADTYIITYDFTGADFPDIGGTNVADQISRTVEVVDTTPPTATFDCSPSVPTLGSVTCTLVPSESVIVTNPEDGSITHIFTENGSFTFDFIDDSGNNGSATVTVSNIDKIAPLISSIYATTQNTIEVTFNEDLKNDPTDGEGFHHPQAADFRVYNIVDGTRAYYGVGSVSYTDKKVTLTLTNPIQAGQDPQLDVFCTQPPASIMDLAGNEFDCESEYDHKVYDKIPPILFVPENITTTVSVVDFTVTATDVVDDEIAVNCSPASGSSFLSGVTTVSCTATDTSNNTATKIFTVTSSFAENHNNGRPADTGGNGGGSFVPVPVVSVAPNVSPQVLGAETFKFTRTLRLGMKGDDVLELHKVLTALGFYNGPADNYFGHLLEKAVKAYQKANPPLKIDGIVGPKTRAVLNK